MYNINSQGAVSPDCRVHIHLTSYREFAHTCGIVMIKANVHGVVEDRGN